MDLILIDINMPRMDGYETVRQIRKINKDVIIIAQTVCAIHGEREKALEAGCNDFVSKPVNTEILLDTVNKHKRKKTIISGSNPGGHYF